MKQKINKHYDLLSAVLSYYSHQHKPSIYIPSLLSRTFNKENTSTLSPPLISSDIQHHHPFNSSSLP